MIRALIAIAAVVLTLVMAACGGEGGQYAGYAPGEVVIETVVVEREVVVDKGVAEAWPAARPAATAAPAPPKQDFAEEAGEGAAGPPGGPGSVGVASNLDRDVAAAAAQERIIVRTVDMEIKVDVLPGAMEDISLLATDFGGWVVDTPGIRQFALWDVIPEEVEGFFVEFRPFVTLCKFPDCSHTHEAGCGVKQAVRRDLITRPRYESYLRIYAGDDDTRSR